MNSDVSFEVFLGTYNASPWIHKTLVALENQSYKSFKVTIIDNASSDNTVELIKNFSKTNKLKNNYRLIQNSINIGPISTFMDRLNIFDTDWIFMVHQDDFYHQNHIEELVKAIKNSGTETGLVFSAMKRMDSDGNELASTPTIASKISSTNRLENFQLALQINPVNFPSCALRKSLISNLNTTRHTSAFNDTELILKLMCISDIKYLPIETVHYRLHRGNAHAITNTDSNDFATLIGLNELFHSNEFKKLMQEYSEKIDFVELTRAINLSLEIRIADKITRNLARGLIAESLIRIFGYERTGIVPLILSAHDALNLDKEQTIIKNLSFDSKFVSSDLKSEEDVTALESEIVQQVNKSKSLLTSTFNSIPLQLRERFFNQVFTSPIAKILNRPFVKAWYHRGKSD